MGRESRTAGYLGELGRQAIGGFWALSDAWQDARWQLVLHGRGNQHVELHFMPANLWAVPYQRMQLGNYGKGQTCVCLDHYEFSSIDPDGC